MVEVRCGAVAAGYHHGLFFAVCAVCSVDVFGQVLGSHGNYVVGQAQLGQSQAFGPQHHASEHGGVVQNAAEASLARRFGHCGACYLEAE